ncbi:MAG: SpoVG family protein [Oscillospiraceae bacterium]|nr:SpoVG family protein [Oscillospiraceae bacterium]
MPDKKLDVRVYPIDEPKGNTKAFASVSIDDIAAIRGIRVVSSKGGLFVTMPQSYDNKADKFHDIAVPLSGLRKEVSKAVLREYKAQTALIPEDRGYQTPDMSAAKDIKVDEIKLGINVFPLEDPEGSTKAFASVNIDGLVAIRGIRVVESEEKGLFVTMPQSQDRTGLFHDVAFPLSGDLRKEISKGVLEKFEAEKSVDRKQSLGNRLADGAQKSAEHVTPVGVAAKQHHPGVLE